MRTPVVALAAAFVAVLDTVTSALRTPHVPVDGGLALFLLTAWALLLLAYLPFVALRAGLARWLEERRPDLAPALLAAFDWVCFAGLAIVVEEPTVPARDVQLHVFYLTIPLAAAAGLVIARLERRFPPLWHVVRAAIAALGLGVASWTHWDRYERVTIACLGAFMVALWSGSSRWAGGLRIQRCYATAAALGLALALLGVAQLTLPYSHTARLVLHSRSAYAHNLLVPALIASDRDFDGAAGWLGGVDCDPHDRAVHPGAREHVGDGRDQNCAHGDGKERPVPASPPLVNTTPRRDVLLLSFDSWRWDATDALPQVRQALGPHLEFERAVSPAPQTFYSLSATIRGRAVRQLKFKRSRRISEDHSPSLADVLNREGYRSFTVLSNRRWASEYGVTGGFDVIWPINYAAREAANEFVDERFVEAETVFTVALTAARETGSPLLCWLHLMESHYPFHRGKRTGPPDWQGFEAALRAVDEQAARFIEDFRQARGTEPIIAVFGDHGEEFGEHGGKNHGNTLYSDQVRVGFWLSLPGIESKTIADPVSIAAIPATVLRQLGVEVPKRFTEPGLHDLALGQGRRELAVSEMPSSTRYMVAYTGQRYRLVTDAVHRTYELFDMDTDPLEQVNIADEAPEALRKLQELARDWDEDG